MGTLNFLDNTIFLFYFIDMPKKSWILKVIPLSGSAEEKEIKITPLKLRLVLSFLIVFFSFLTFSAYRYITLEVDYAKTEKLARENVFLRKELKDLREKISRIDSLLEKIYEHDVNLRTLAQLDPPPPEIKEMGIGGELEEPKDPLAKEIFKNKMDLDRMLKFAEFELNSYQTIATKLEKDVNLRARTPSIYPVNGRFTSGFGYRRDPFTGRIKFHHGVDFAAPPGTPVVAPADGVVRNIKWLSGYGLTMEIYHGYGVSTFYAHLKRVNVRVGQQIHRGDVIAFVGNTGRSTGPHLHYEVRVFGKAVNPLNYIIPPSTYYD